MVNDPARSWRLLSRALAALVLIYLMLPIVAVLPLSVNSASLLSFPLQGFSWKWYEALWSTPRWRDSVVNSLIVGGATVALATPLGTLAALGLSRASFPGKSLLIVALLSPMILPTIIAAVGIYFFFAPLGLANSLSGLVLAHTALATPFVLISVSGAVHAMDANLLRAASSLGAGPLRAFRCVTLPLIMPGVLSGAIFAFAVSFDEVVVAMLLTGPGQRTLPRELLSGTRENMDPTIMAVATLLILVSSALLLACSALQQRAQRKNS